MTQHKVFELRRYRLRPGARETLINLFDGEFIEPQEALGMRIEGEFRDPGDPDAFVWIRSFENMEARTKALQSFYSGPAWRRHGPAANATMLNSDNVLLLKPAGGVQPFLHNLQRKEETERPRGSGLIIANICSLTRGTEDGFAKFFRENALPIMQDAGARIDAVLVTEHRANGFPMLPVRQGETVLVWLECHRSEEAFASYQYRLRQNARWAEDTYPQMDGQCWRRIEMARLMPTSRSLCAW